jgi:hypothetical protein
LTYAAKAAAIHLALGSSGHAQRLAPGEVLAAGTATLPEWLI